MKFTAKVGLAAAVSALVLGPLMGAVVFLEARGVLQELIVNSQVHLARGVMREIDTALAKALTEVKLIAADEFLREFAEAPTGEGGRRMVGEELEGREQLTGPWDALVVFDAAGNVLFAPNPLGDSPNLADHPLSLTAFRHALEGGVYSSDRVTESGTGRPVVIFAAPVYGEVHEDKVVGVVVAHYVWGAIPAILDHVDPIATVHLLDKERRIIGARSDDTRQIEDIPLFNETEADGDARYVILPYSVHDPQETLSVLLSQRGLGDYGGSGWTLLVQLPLQTVFAPITTMAWHTALLVLAVLSLLAVLFLLLGRRFLSPLAYLVRGVQRVAEGRLDEQVAVHSRDEFGELADNFNTMVSRLRETTVSRDNLDRIVNTMTGSLMVLSPDGVIRTVNHGTLEMLGLREEELVGQPGNTVMVGREAAFTPDGIAAMLRHGAIRDLETAYRNAAGQPVPVLLSVSLMQDPDGAIEGVVCSAVDIRERQRAEADIRRLNEELEEKVKTRTAELVAAQEELVRTEKLATLGQVAGVVGHELRNPLGVINNAVYFLKTVLPDADDTTREYLGIIGDEIGHADRIVSDLLDSVRTKPPNLQPLAVATLVADSLNKCTIGESVVLELALNEEMPLIAVDPRQMQQVIINLVENAVEAMPDGGELHIDAEPVVGAVRLNVRDTGTGIAPENIPNLFRPLFTTKARGLGLGLTVVKNLTENNGGTVSVASEPDKGTTVSLVLPVARQE